MVPTKIVSGILASIIFCASLLSVAPTAAAAVKVFVKEYTYQASEIDSKVTSRAIALEQVKRLLLEEFGTFLISETDVRNFQLTKDRVTVLTAGIVKTEILAEKWDGKTYYVKAKISADPQETAKAIEELKEHSQKNRELEETSRKADEALKKIKQLQDELAAGKFPESRQTEYFKAVDELKWKEWIDKGVAFMAAENYEAALNAFNRAVDINPNNPWAYIDKGWALNTLGDYYQALKELNKASVIDPQNAWVYINRGVSYNFLGNYKQALADEDEAILLDAAISWAYIDRGWAYIGLGDYRRALADLNKAAQMDPGNPHVYSMRAWAYNGLGNKAQVLEDFDKSLSLAPNNSWMHWNKAAYYALTGEKAKALAELGTAIRLNSTLKQRAKADKNLESLWNDIDFKKLVD
jgi:tetratricopeptide (TPR) repeat protein